MGVSFRAQASVNRQFRNVPRLKPLRSCTYLVAVAPGRVPGTVEPKGKEPLSTVASLRDGLDRPTLVSKARPDAAETLRIVLARLDDMKAEDTTTIDLRKDSALTDYMVVTSGRSNRHVGSVADRVLEDLRDAGRLRRAGRRHAAMRLGPDRCGGRDRPRLPPGSAHLLQSRAIVDAGSRAGARQLIVRL